MSQWLAERFRFADDDPVGRAVRDALRGRLCPGTAVLDVGCGEGAGALHVAAVATRPVQYIGIDPDPDACAVARRTLAELGSEHVHGTIKNMSIQDYAALRPAPVHLQLWVRAMHECVDRPEPEAVCALGRLAAALLRPGGWVLVSDPCLGPGASAEELARIEAYDRRVAVGSSGRPHLDPARIEDALLQAGLRIVERRETPRYALARYLGLAGARQLLLVGERPL